MGFFFLLIAIPLLLIYLWIAGKTIGWMRDKYPQTKWPARLTLIFWILLPTWDSILALSYHRYVCATAPDIGLTVYQTVKLDPKLFDPKTGKPMIFDKWGGFDKNIVGERFKLDDKVNQYLGSWPLMVNHWEVKLIDTQTNTTLAKLLDYQPRGGMWWWNVFFGRLGELRGIGGASCLGRNQFFDYLDEIVRKPFVLAN